MKRLSIEREIRMNNQKFIKGCHRKNQFIFAGRLDKTKGIDKLMEAWKLLSQDYKNVPLLLVCGTGPEEKWCRNFIKVNGLEKMVKMLGFVKNKIIMQLISESKSLILPTQWYEGFPMTIVESYGHGTPVLGSALGNVGNLVIDGVTGFTFDQRFPEAIVEAVRKVLLINYENIDLHKSAYEYYKDHYTSEDNYKDMMGIYDVIIGN